MIRLMPQTENRWLILPRGVKVEVRPCTTALSAAAGSEAARRTAAEQREAEAAAAAGQPLDAQGFNAANEAVINGLYYQYQVEAMARMAVIRWENVGDADGNPLPVSPASIAALMAIPEFAGAFRMAYDLATSDLVAEGNASPPTSAGDAAAGESTATVATSAPESPVQSLAPSAEAAPAS